MLVCMILNPVWLRMNLGDGYRMTTWSCFKKKSSFTNEQCSTPLLVDVVCFSFFLVGVGLYDPICWRWYDMIVIHDLGIPFLANQHEMERDLGIWDLEFHADQTKGNDGTIFSDLKSPTESSSSRCFCTVIFAVSPPGFRFMVQFACGNLDGWSCWSLNWPIIEFTEHQSAQEGNNYLRAGEPENALDCYQRSLALLGRLQFSHGSGTSRRMMAEISSKFHFMTTWRLKLTCILWLLQFWWLCFFSLVNLRSDKAAKRPPEGRRPQCRASRGKWGNMGRCGENAGKSGWRSTTMWSVGGCGNCWFCFFPFLRCDLGGINWEITGELANKTWSWEYPLVMSK